MSKGSKITMVFIIVILVSMPLLTSAFDPGTTPRGEGWLANVSNNSWREEGGWNAIGEGAKKAIGGVLLAPFELALTGLKGVAAILLDWSTRLLVFMMSPELITGVFFSETARTGISTGWRVVRDFVNMFYLLILLFLAITTILGVNKYSDKKLFVGVILSALLVNFSLPITLFVIDISNLAMSFFADAIQANAGALLADKSGIETLFRAEGNMNAKGMGVLFFEVMAIFIMAIMFFVLAATLVIRLIAFWVLLILSPLAFFAWAVPGGAVRGIFNDWFTKLTKYAFYGPVLLFFIFLSIIIMNALTQSLTITGSPIGDRSSGSTGALIISFLIPYIAAIYLLFYGYEQSQKIAAGAGKSLNKLLDKGEAWAKKGMKASIGVGTLGAVPAAQYGAKAAKEYGKVGMAGARERVGDIKGMGWVSKKKGEDRKKKFGARVAGGDTQREFEVNEANTMVSEIEKQGGKTEKEIEAMMGGKDTTTKNAALILAAKGGHFKRRDGQNSVEGFDEIMQSKSVKNNKVLANKFREESKKTIQKEATDGKIEDAETMNDYTEILRKIGSNDDEKEALVKDLTKNVSKSRVDLAAPIIAQEDKDLMPKKIDGIMDAANTKDDDERSEKIGEIIRVNKAIGKMIDLKEEKLREQGHLKKGERMTKEEQVKYLTTFKDDRGSLEKTAQQAVVRDIYVNRSFDDLTKQKSMDFQGNRHVIKRYEQIRDKMGEEKFKNQAALKMSRGQLVNLEEQGVIGGRAERVENDETDDQDRDNERPEEPSIDERTEEYGEKISPEERRETLKFEGNKFEGKDKTSE